MRDKTILILGLGREGQSTYRYLRAAFPEKELGLADQLPLEKLESEVAEKIRSDSRLRLHLGPDYLGSLTEYDSIVKSPGIPVTLPALRQAVKAGKQITSHSAIFFASCPGKIIGVTGTKGKSTTASLIHTILERASYPTFLVGNIGAPALDMLPQAGADTVFVYELSSHQLLDLRQSPPMAVLLNVVPEHLDYYQNFDQYVAAKENITRHQTERDALVYDADHEIPREIASRSRARRFACSLNVQAWRPVPTPAGCFLEEDWIVYRSEQGKQEQVVRVQDVPLLGRFNLGNVAAAVAVGKLAGVSNDRIAEAVRGFQPLEHRLELVGTYGGVTYYNDAIATVPEATMAALDTLGEAVETILLGGADRHLDFSCLAKRLLRSNIKTVILFPPTGESIWQAVCEQSSTASALPRHFFVNSMEEAVALAKQHTAKGRICLHSPASASFGLFRDYRHRGTLFKRLVQENREERGP
ncbi:MAG: UDP-N-acetylmuramoyl-L-alanine--D-glutamate ligase [Acidobacteria bacterium]|nr:UDP-N-acetylmuramoyl-L-alanine--D-glutamate ligase [Acidobacteriota bacterium]